MKFSILIPTHNRSNLLAVVVRYAMQLEHADFEVIVSDNSTSDEERRLNDEAVASFRKTRNLRVIRPPRVLSPPEHFEFALNAAAGEYVVYLTDKMVILPHVLAVAERAFEATGADIVNWGYAEYYLNDPKNPAGCGTLVMAHDFIGGNAELFDPTEALRFKASGETPRNKQKSHDYVQGKIVFGCYRKSLIDRIRAKSGTLFEGATHDYSAMIQALALAGACVMLDMCSLVFLSLPRDQSLGSLTDTDSQAALRYYRSFSDPDGILSNLLIPGLYSSQHNMVAHDYNKFLPLYGKEKLFNVTNWLMAIHSDLASESKIWLNEAERLGQLKLFSDRVEEMGQRKTVMRRLQAAKRQSEQKIGWESVRKRVLRVFKRPARVQPQNMSYHTLVANSLQEAVQNLLDTSVPTSLENIGGRSHKIDLTS